MSGIDRYDRQLKLLDNLDSQLGVLHKYIEEAQSTYHGNIMLAASHGFMDDYTDKLHEKYKVFSDYANELRASIASSKFEIEWQEGQIRELIANAAREQ